MKFLGIKIGDHDYNFSFSDGIKVRYHKTERNLQIKHHGSMDPLLWIPVLKKWGVSPDELDAICVTSDEELYRESIDPTCLYHQIKTELWFPGINCPTYRLDHHLAHALSSWPILTQEPSTYFVFDGDGDFKRGHSIFDRDLNLVSSTTVQECTSFGYFLEEISLLLGITGNRLDLSGKAMGLKSYGTVNQDYKKLIDIMSLTDFDRASDIKLWEAITMSELKDSKLDYLATMHNFAEQKFPEFFKKFAATDDVIVFSGGVAQNSVLNGKIQNVFKNCIIPPHASDDGLSLGCIEFLRLHYNQEKFDNSNFPFWQDDPVPEAPSTGTIKKVAELLAQGKIVGWHQGQGEIGPRALGNRSILMDPRSPNGKDIINNRVKHRESFRPFGASVLKSSAGKYFDISYESPYMLHVVDTLNNDLPAVTHVDGSSRIHTVDHRNKFFEDLIEEFNLLVQCPVILNTSLNNNGKPIASTEQDSIEFFKNSGLDALCIGDRIYKK